MRTRMLISRINPTLTEEVFLFIWYRNQQKLPNICHTLRASHKNDNTGYSRLEHPKIFFTEEMKSENSSQRADNPAQAQATTR